MKRMWILLLMVAMMGFLGCRQPEKVNDDDKTEEGQGNGKDDELFEADMQLNLDEVVYLFKKGDNFSVEPNPDYPYIYLETQSYLDSYSVEQTIALIDYHVVGSLGSVVTLNPDNTVTVNAEYISIKGNKKGTDTLYIIACKTPSNGMTYGEWIPISKGKSIEVK